MAVGFVWSRFLHGSFHSLTSSYPLLDRFNLLQPGSATITVPDLCSHLRDLSISSANHMAGRKKEKARVDLERQVYTRPSAKKTIEPKSREPKRKPLSVQDYDVQTIHPRKSQGQSSQNNVRIRDRSHRQNYDIHDQSEDTNESDEAFAPPASRAGLKTERIYSESNYRPKQRGRNSLIIS